MEWRASWLKCWELWERRAGGRNKCNYDNMNITTRDHLSMFCLRYNNDQNYPVMLIMIHGLVNTICTYRASCVHYNRIIYYFPAEPSSDRGPGDVDTVADVTPPGGSYWCWWARTHRKPLLRLSISNMCTEKAVFNKLFPPKVGSWDDCPQVVSISINKLQALALWITCGRTHIPNSKHF